MVENSVMEVSEYDKIQSIARKIKKIKDKKILVSIMQIITTLNPELQISENSNGLFIKFNGLVPETYLKLEIFLNKNLRRASMSETAATSEYVPYSLDEVSGNFDKYKLSNKEKTLIKKRKYSMSIENNIKNEN